MDKHLGCPCVHSACSLPFLCYRPCIAGVFGDNGTGKGHHVGREKDIPEIVGDLKPGDLCFDSTDGYVRLVLAQKTSHMGDRHVILYQFTPVTGLCRWRARDTLIGLDIYRNGKLIY